jgi:signal transduction histidine kinase
MKKQWNSQYSPDALLDEHRMEVGQANVRGWVALVATVYILARALGVGPTFLPMQLATYVAIYFIAYFLFSLAILAHVKRSPGHLLWRRLLPMIGDYGSLATVMIIGGEATMAFYAIILWVTLGNGMRFGQSYLLIAACVSQIALLVIYLVSNYWHSEHELMLTFSITALVIPSYASMILRQTAQARDAAITAMQAKSRFLAQASHDLRQPIHAIGYHIEALRDSRMTGAQTRLVDRIERSLGGVARLFKSLLDISKLDSGNVEAKHEVFALQPLLSDLVQQNEQILKWHKVELRQVPTTVSVRADPTLLATMVQNLLTNAFKYSNGKSVLLGVRRQGETVSIEVHDQGIGIQAEHLPNIFEEFYRAHVAGDHDVEGVGLGLSIVKRLANLCEFSVELNSVRGTGTSVKITNVPVSHDFAIRALEPLREAPQPLAGMRVIIIDDDPDILEATANLLIKWGCTVQASTGLPAEPEDADLAIVDFDLGGGSTGVAALSHLRIYLGKPLPALLMTGHAEDKIKALIKGDANTTFLSKPVQPATLRSSISAIRLRLRNQTELDRS